MYRWIYWLIISSLMVLGAGCNQVGFEEIPAEEEPGCQDSDIDCVTDRGVDHFDYTVNTARGKVDILFVSDNSGSMYVEQQKMAQRFENLLTKLGTADFRIAVTTTELSGGDIPVREYNDGRLIPFADGAKILTRNSGSESQVVSMFQNTIKRPETFECEQSNFTNCPSPDERGVYAARLAIERNSETNFIRSGAHFALVILSDEDVRSQGGNLSDYPLESYDKPSNFISQFHNLFGTTKTLSAHAVIVRPGDNMCLDEQNSQNRVSGYEGRIYRDLVNLTEGGVLGDICADDYAEQMGDIGQSIAERTNTLNLPCPPIDDKITVTFTPTPPNEIQVTLEASKQVLRFSEPVPEGTEIRLQFKCEKE